MIACTSTASASRRKSTSPSTPRLRSSPRTSMLSLTTSSPPRASAVFAREDDAVVSLSLDLCYTTSWDSTNTGGTSLTPQEVRNCVYHGPFNDLLMQLNENATWRELVGSPQPDKRMRDVELIARFLALAERHRSYTKPMKDFISDYMLEYQNSTAHGRFEKLFASTVKRVVEHLGPRPFHIKRGLNAAAFDSVMVAFASKTNGVPRDVRARYNRLLKDKPFVEATTAGTTDESVVESRIARAQAVLFE